MSKPTDPRFFNCSLDLEVHSFAGGAQLDDCIVELSVDGVDLRDLFRQIGRKTTLDLIAHLDANAIPRDYRDWLTS